MEWDQLNVTYQHYIKVPTGDADQFKKLVIGSDLDQLGLRSVAWKVMLGLISPPPFQPESCLELNKLRLEYVQLKKKYILDPAKAMKADRNKEVVKVNPLAPDSDNPWTQYFKDEGLRKVIYQDVDRTFPDQPLFREPKIHSLMVDILFIYCKLNPKLSYRQGMHELLAPFLYCLHRDQLKSKTDLSSFNSGQKSLVAIIDSEHFEADGFWMFNKLMSGADKFYHMPDMGEANRLAKSYKARSLSVKSNSSSPKYQPRSSSPILSTCFRLYYTHLSTCDPTLLTHLESLDIEPQLFGLRWFRLLFSREFNFNITLKVWDKLFANSKIENGGNLDLSYVEYVAVAMLLYLHDQVVSQDYTVTLQRLMRYPSPTSIDPIMSYAQKLKFKCDIYTGHDILKSIYKSKGLNPNLLPIINGNEIEKEKDKENVINKEIPKDVKVQVKPKTSSTASNPIKVIKPSTNSLPIKSCQIPISSIIKLDTELAENFKSILLWLKQVEVSDVEKDNKNLAVEQLKVNIKTLRKRVRYLNLDKEIIGVDTMFGFIKVGNFDEVDKEEGAKEFISSPLNTPPTSRKVISDEGVKEFKNSPLNTPPTSRKVDLDENLKVMINSHLNSPLVSEKVNEVEILNNEQLLKKGKEEEKEEEVEKEEVEKEEEEKEEEEKEEVEKEEVEKEEEEKEEEEKEEVEKEEVEKEEVEKEEEEKEEEEKEEVEKEEVEKEEVEKEEEEKEEVEKEEVEKEEVEKEEEEKEEEEKEEVEKEEVEKEEEKEEEEKEEEEGKDLVDKLAKSQVKQEVTADFILPIEKEELNVIKEVTKDESIEINQSQSSIKEPIEDNNEVNDNIEFALHDKVDLKDLIKSDVMTQSEQSIEEKEMLVDELESDVIKDVLNKEQLLSHQSIDDEIKKLDQPINNQLKESLDDDISDKLEKDIESKVKISNSSVQELITGDEPKSENEVSSEDKMNIENKAIEEKVEKPEVLIKHSTNKTNLNPVDDEIKLELKTESKHIKNQINEENNNKSIDPKLEKQKFDWIFGSKPNLSPNTTTPKIKLQRKTTPILPPPPPAKKVELPNPSPNPFQQPPLNDWTLIEPINQPNNNPKDINLDTTTLDQFQPKINDSYQDLNLQFQPKINDPDLFQNPW